MIVKTLTLVFLVTVPTLLVAMFVSSTMLTISLKVIVTFCILECVDAVNSV